MKTLLLMICLSFSFATAGDIRNFRKFSEIANYPYLSHEGVENKLISGSGQMTAANFLELEPMIKSVECDIDRIILIDLRLESHGYVNNLPISWKTEENLGKSVEQILLDESALLQELFKVHDLDGYPIHSVASEQELAILHGLDYVRLPTLDHSHPSDNVVDAFIHLIKENPKAWLHVHCAVGKGRTTLFMAMYDMFYNAKNVSFDEILERQKEIGGQDFKKCLDSQNKNAKKQQLFLDRLSFLEQFYQFCQNESGFSWQEWSSLRKVVVDGTTS